MNTKTKPTSLDKVRNALTEHGWDFTVESTRVIVPDHDRPYGRRSYQRKQVDGYQIKASNGAGYDYDRYYFGGPQSFSVSFTASGAYLAKSVRGQYPFHQDITLAKMLEQIAFQSKRAMDERQAERQVKEQAEDAEEQRKVAEAYAEAQQALTEAQHAAHALLTAEIGLTDDQARAIVIEAQREDNNVFANLTFAQHTLQQRGKGWLPGSHSVRGTYVDGKRVG